ARTPLGQRLVAKGLISDEQLQQAITSPVRRRLGRELLLRGWLNSEQLVATLAEQMDLPWAPLNPFKLDPQLIAKLPRKLATHYGVLPVAEDGDTLVLASESPVSQVSLGVISRHLKRPVSARLAPQGRVTLGLRYHYPSPWQKPETREMLAILERHQDDEVLLEQVSHHQVMLGALLQVRGMVPVTLFNQALIDFDPEHQSLGEHLIARGIITEQVLQQALIEQASEQQAAFDLTREVA
ncbi:glycosyl transferase family protein, partial [Pseudomonas plecoglossicida]